MLLTWPAFAITFSLAPGIASSKASATSSGLRRSPSPQMSKVGASMLGRRLAVSVSASEPSCIQKVLAADRPIGKRELCGRIGRGARARRIPGDDIELVRKLRKLPAPDAQVAEEPVQEHKRRPRASAPVCDRASADVDA